MLASVFDETPEGELRAENAHLKRRIEQLLATKGGTVWTE